MEEASDDDWVQPDVPGKVKGARYYPDDSKCDNCFKRKSICNRNEVGTPCDSCKNRHAACRDQTEETKSLIHPKDRNRKPLIQVAEKVQQDPPCRTCYEKGRGCYRYGPEGTPCIQCQNIRRGKPCNFDLTGAVTPAQTKTDTRAGGEHAVPREQKCYRCERRGLSCNGKYPCNKCTTARTRNSCMNTSEAKRKKTLPKCNTCEARKQFCNKERPCSTCIKGKQNCTYTEQSGLVNRHYKVDGAPKIANIQTDVLDNGESSDDECTRCKRKRLNCDGGQPRCKCEIPTNCGKALCES